MLTLLHATLGNAMILFLLICAIWSFGAFLLRQSFSPSLVSTLILAEGLILAQGFLGIILLLLGFRSSEGVLHVLYGIAAAISLPAAHLYTRGRPDRARLLVFGLTSIWIVGLSIRGITTGS